MAICCLTVLSAKAPLLTLSQDARIVIVVGLVLCMFDCSRPRHGRSSALLMRGAALRSEGESDNDISLRAFTRFARVSSSG
jgi:hypothetical protein